MSPWPDLSRSAGEFLARNPEAGEMIPGMDGLRKVRWSRAGSGKSAGVRVIDYTPFAAGNLLLLVLYAQSERGNLSAKQLLEIRHAIERATTDRLVERATIHRGKPGFDRWQGTIPPTMSPLVLEIPDDTLLSLKLTGEDAAAAIRLAASVKLYELGRLSSGAAARRAGVPRVVFLSKLADYGVDTFHLTADELERQAPLV